ncbi:MAG: putative DNA binding domain-containing protein [Deltaproteobacteria bacterium]|nr:putative DNA binding domain-containing protein [Candidatus Desulfobacula maris]
MSNFFRRLLEQPEGKTIEFKQDLSSSKSMMKALVAFANTAGGRLIIGVSDDRQILGVEDPLSQEERLCSMIADSIVPRLVPNIEMITIEDKTLLIAEVFLSSSRPHFLRSKGAETGVYVRLGSTNRQADLELIAELRRTVEGVAFDEMPMPELSIDDLDTKAIAQSVREKYPVDKTELQTLKLLVSHQGRLVPSKGAIILFGRERNLSFSDVWVQCGRFTGTDKSDIFDHIEIYDHLPLAVDSIMLFLKKHAMRGADFSEIRRKDVWSIPLGILREAVINALVHADYSQRGAPIRIAFFDDRIEIENPGILMPGMTIKDMKQGISRIRNPVIARFFREMNLIEQWGTGVPRMFKQAQELGLPEPQIMEIGMRMRFVVGLGEPIQIEHTGKKDQAQVEAQVEAQVDFQILAACANAPLSSAEISTALGHKQLSGNLRKALPRLRQAELLEFTVPDKPKSRLQKYRITAKGRQLTDNGML